MASWVERVPPPPESRVLRSAILAVIYVLTGMMAGVVIGGPVVAAMVFLAQGGDYLTRLWSAPTLLVLCTGIALILAWVQFVLNAVNKWKSRRPLRKKI
jgi:hypothetical protein